jgi:methylated-DNA-protein-cysteine methyltransferase-like protein
VSFVQTLSLQKGEKLFASFRVAQSHYFKQVYEVVRTVPPGRVTTYGAVADYLALGSARMVGWALRNLSAMDGDVPAHRVVNRVGYLSGRNHFASPGLMQALLESEGVEIRDDTVVKMKELFWHPADGD